VWRESTVLRPGTRPKQKNKKALRESEWLSKKEERETQNIGALQAGEKKGD